MSWIDKILPPQIQQSDPANRKTVPEGLWVKCGGCDAVLYSSDIEANLSVCPKCSHHMRINARKRLDHLLDPKPRLEIGESVYPVDALKFKDSKKYPDRLKQASDASGESEALVELPGRFQVLPGRPTVVLDVAHNPHAAATLAESIEAMAYHPYTYAVFGAMADKDIDGVLKPLLNTVDYWYCTDLPTPRAASASDLAKRLRAFNKEALVFMDPGAAYQAALDKAGEGDR
ncbi:MAG: hypothetical protein EBW16_01675, partial [Burkholderiaceae bacterium]|nr:hypothetical protein [Burkholderiaceae bacterium]